MASVHAHPANSAANPAIFESALHEYATHGRGKFLIRKEKVADPKISGYVWTGPQWGMNFEDITLKSKKGTIDSS